MAKQTTPAKASEVAGTCKNMADAFLVVDGECKYTFPNGAAFNGIEDELLSDGSKTYKGFTLALESSEACGEEKYMVQFNA